MKPGTVIAAIVTLAVVATAATGLYLIGPPSEQRAREADNGRVRDLTQLEQRVDRYRRTHDTLPETLEMLVDENGLNPLPTDPVTGERYVYRRLDESRFELCAQFARRRESAGSYDEWAHEAGLHCFERPFPSRRDVEVQRAVIE